MDNDNAEVLSKKIANGFKKAAGNAAFSLASSLMFLSNGNENLFGLLMLPVAGLSAYCAFGDFAEGLEQPVEDLKKEEALPKNEPAI
jgi:hypothetical protein